MPRSSRPKGLRLSSRLFLLLLLSGVVPLALLLTVGWLQFRQQLRLWGTPSVELALDASLKTNRASIDRMQRQLETVGQQIVVHPEFGRKAIDDPIERSPALAELRAQLETPGVDLLQYYAREETGWSLVLTVSGDSTVIPDASPRLSLPRIGEYGPSPTQALNLGDARGDLLAIPTYLWPADPESRGDPIMPRGCVVVGTVLGPEFFSQLNTASRGLQFYPRMVEVGDLLRKAYLILFVLALFVSLGFSLWLARRVARGVSRPVERLVDAMQAVGRGEAPSDEVRTRIPEMQTLSEAFHRMRGTLSRYEERLREVEQVKGAQQTARFVAHEIRNTLTPVKAGLSVLAKRVDALPEQSRESGRRALEIITREADRMAELAQSFSEYAHLPDPNPEPIDLALLLRSLAERDVPDSVRLVIDLPAQLPAIFADRDEMERLFRNLIKNGVESMSEDHDDVEDEDQDADAGQVPVRDRVLTLRAGTSETEDPRVWVEVADSGRGMDPHTLEQAVHPGFTTKETGTGLGLALVRHSVSRYDGTLKIESEIGRGTRCRITFPIHRPGPEQRKEID